MIILSSSLILILVVLRYICFLFCSYDTDPAYIQRMMRIPVQNIYTCKSSSWPYFMIKKSNIRHTDRSCYCIILRIVYVNIHIAYNVYACVCLCENTSIVNMNYLLCYCVLVVLYFLIDSAHNNKHERYTSMDAICVHTPYSHSMVGISSRHHCSANLTNKWLWMYSELIHTQTTTTHLNARYTCMTAAYYLLSPCMPAWNDCLALLKIQIMMKYIMGEKEKQNYLEQCTSICSIECPYLVSNCACLV